VPLSLLNFQKVQDLIKIYFFIDFNGDYCRDTSFLQKHVGCEDFEINVREK